MAIKGYNKARALRIIRQCPKCYAAYQNGDTSSKKVDPMDPNGWRKKINDLELAIGTPEKFLDDALSLTARAIGHEDTIAQLPDLSFPAHLGEEPSDKLAHIALQIRQNRSKIREADRRERQIGRFIELIFILWCCTLQQRCKTTPDRQQLKARIIQALNIKASTADKLMGVAMTVYGLMLKLKTTFWKERAYSVPLLIGKKLVTLANNPKICQDFEAQSSTRFSNDRSCEYWASFAPHRVLNKIFGSSFTTQDSLYLKHMAYEKQQKQLRRSVNQNENGEDLITLCLSTERQIDSPLEELSRIDSDLVMQDSPDLATLSSLSSYENDWDPRSFVPSYENGSASFTSYMGGLESVIPSSLPSYEGGLELPPLPSFLPPLPSYENRWDAYPWPHVAL